MFVFSVFVSKKTKRSLHTRALLPEVVSFCTSNSLLNSYIAHCRTRSREASRSRGATRSPSAPTPPGEEAATRTAATRRTAAEAAAAARGGRRRPGRRGAPPPWPPQSPSGERNNSALISYLGLNVLPLGWVKFMCTLSHTSQSGARYTPVSPTSDAIS